MAWRLHLTNQAVQHVNIIGKVLAAWSRKDQVILYDLLTGATLKEQTLSLPTTDNRKDEMWQTFFEQVKTPDGSYLPTVHIPQMTLYNSPEGRMRLYRQGATKLILDVKGTESTLDTKDATYFATVAFDRKTGLIATIDRSGKLFVYQQQILIDTYDLDLDMSIDLRPDIVITQGGGPIVLTDGKQLIIVQPDGKVLKREPIYYVVRMLACSPNGQYVITSDMETDVIRVYNGDDLQLAYQRFAIDLIAEATQVQLLADLPPATVALSDLAINNDGVIAFSMSGVICVTELSQMDKISRRAE